MGKLINLFFTYMRENVLFSRLVIAGFVLVMMTSLAIIFKKIRIKPWKAFIPFYDIVVMFNTVEIPIWMIILCFIPFANFIGIPFLTILLGWKFGTYCHKGIIMKLGLMFFPPLFYPFLAYSNIVLDGKIKGDFEPVLPKNFKLDVVNVEDVVVSGAYNLSNDVLNEIAPQVKRTFTYTPIASTKKENMNNPDNISLAANTGDVEDLNRVLPTADDLTFDYSTLYEGKISGPKFESAVSTEEEEPEEEVVEEEPVVEEVPEEEPEEEIVLPVIHDVELETAEPVETMGPIAINKRDELRGERVTAKKSEVIGTIPMEEIENSSSQEVEGEEEYAYDEELPEDDSIEDPVVSEESSQTPLEENTSTESVETPVETTDIEENINSSNSEESSVDSTNIEEETAVEEELAPTEEVPPVENTIDQEEASKEENTDALKVEETPVEEKEEPALEETPDDKKEKASSKKKRKKKDTEEESDENTEKMEEPLEEGSDKLLESKENEVVEETPTEEKTPTEEVLEVPSDEPTEPKEEETVVDTPVEEIAPMEEKLEETKIEEQLSAEDIFGVPEIAPEEPLPVEEPTEVVTESPVKEWDNLVEPTAVPDTVPAEVENPSIETDNPSTPVIETPVEEPQELPVLEPLPEITMPSLGSIEPTSPSDGPQMAPPPLDEELPEVAPPPDLTIDTTPIDNNEPIFEPLKPVDIEETNVYAPTQTDEVFSMNIEEPEALPVGFLVVNEPVEVPTPQAMAQSSDTLISSAVEDKDTDVQNINDFGTTEMTREEAMGFSKKTFFDFGGEPTPTNNTNPVPNTVSLPPDMQQSFLQNPMMGGSTTGAQTMTVNGGETNYASIFQTESSNGESLLRPVEGMSDGSDKVCPVCGTKVKSDCPVCIMCGYHF